MRNGRRIAPEIVATFGDLQRALHLLPSETAEAEVTVARGKDEAQELTLELKLPAHWRVTDINRRSIGHSMTPFPEFWGKALSTDEKKKLGVDPDGFATRVSKFWSNTNGKRSGMRQDDIVFSINGVTKSPLAINAMIYIRTHFETGAEIEVRYLRGKEKRSAKFKLRAKPW